MLWDKGRELPHPSSLKAVQFHWKVMGFSLSGPMLGFGRNIKMSKTIREPLGSSVSWGNPGRSTAITQEVSTHIICPKTVEREWLSTKA